MQTSTNPLAPAAVELEPRTQALFAEHQQRIHERTDRMFATLMVLQWLAGIVAALWISPNTWIGTQSQIHFHVWAAIFIGGGIASLPVLLAWQQPGRALTRHVIAVAQMLTSALLIHLSGGRIETHFHVFGSLAFLAFYRDWKVLITATVIVAADHFVRGVFWPQSVFGVMASSPWRWVEHAAWVVFEDVFLLISIRQSVGETRLIAQRQAELEKINESVERAVEERTRQLEQSHVQLAEAGRKAGAAEIATSVLHNVGNVLNSINVSASMVADRVQNSKDANVAKVGAMMRAQGDRLGEFMAHDAKGRQLPVYLEQLGGQLAADREYILRELKQLANNVGHIKDIVAVQQSFAKVAGATETIKVTDLLEDALRMNAGLLMRKDVQFVREYDEQLPEITVEKHKVLQILVNLIRNAKQACQASPSVDKRLTLRATHDANVVRIAVIDNGVGISAENLPRIFQHGFTTKKDGHGFGLHGGAAAAREMGGSLKVHSDGPGKGAVFTLELPRKRQRASAVEEALETAGAI